MSQPSDPPIVISGGSITITIPKELFEGLPGGDFTNPLKQITQIEITGSGIANYSEKATGREINIRIDYGNP